MRPFSFLTIVAVVLCGVVITHAQNTSTSEPTAVRPLRMAVDDEMVAPAPTGMQPLSVPAPAHFPERDARAIQFAALPGVGSSELFSIPARDLSEAEKRTSLLAQEAQANLETKTKFYPERPTARARVDESTPRIEAMAEMLGKDVVRIFKFVRDTIRTEHQPKANKGAHMTLVIGSGGAGDKAALLFSLLEAAGKAPGDEIRYVTARVKFPIYSKFSFGLADLTGWSPAQVTPGLPTSEELTTLAASANAGKVAVLPPVGSTQNAPTASQLAGTNRHGIASILRDNAWTITEVPTEQNYIEAERVWIKVKVGSEWIHLDPSFPRRRFMDVPTQNRPSVPDYNRSEFLNAFAETPPAPSSLIPNTNNVRRVGFSNLPKTRELMALYAEAFYDLYRSGGDREALTMNDIISFLREEHPQIDGIAELKLLGCPWLLGALGAGISNPIPTNPQSPGYPVETDLFPAENHAWVLNWGWGSDGKPGKTTRDIDNWTTKYQFLMPAMMGETLSLEQTAAKIAILRLGKTEVYRSPSALAADNVSDIAVLSITQIPDFPVSVTADVWNTLYCADGLRELPTSGANEYPGDYAPFAVYSLGANYLHAWSYLNRFSQDYIRDCGERIEKLRREGVADSSIEMQLESLNAMISTYRYQDAKVVDLASGMAPASVEYLYAIADGCHIDGRCTIDFQTWHLSQNFSRVLSGDPWLKVAGWCGSALEHSVVQQALRGSSNNAFSTAKFLAKSSTSQPLYVLGPEMSSTAYRSLADVTKVNTAANKYQPYVTTLINNSKLLPGTEIVNSRTALNYLILPHLNGSSRDGFQGWFVLAADPGAGYMIGTAGGGLAGFLGAINPFNVIGNFFSGLMQGLSGVMPGGARGPGTIGNPNAPNAHGNDPIDMRTGAYIHETSDLSVHGQPGLLFTRFYDSGRALDRSGRLGYGWTHNHLKRLAIRSAMGGQFGETGRPEDAARMLTAALVLRDLLTAAAEDTKNSVLPAGNPARPTELFWNRTRSLIASACVATWAADELVESDAVLTIGNSDFRFSRVPKSSGSYATNVNFRSPVGLPEWKLIRDGTGKFVLGRRYAGRMDFPATPSTDGFHYCTTDADAYGNALVYTIAADGRVTSVMSRPKGLTTGPKLTMAYATDNQRLLTVKTSTDLATLNLTYKAATNHEKYLLESARPPVCFKDTFRYTYAYDAHRRLTTAIDPQGRAIMRNEYGGDGRVHFQYSEGLDSQKWRYEWLPGMSKEINPKGDATEFHYDDRSRLIGIRDNEGKLNRFGLDDEDRIVAVHGPDDQLLLEKRFFSAMAVGGDPETDSREGVLLSEARYGAWNGSSVLAAADITLAAQAAPQETVTEYHYDHPPGWHQGLPTSITITGGGTTELRYQLGSDTQPGRDPAPHQVVDPLNRVTTFVRDARGNVLTEVTPDDTIIRTYDNRGRATKQTQLNNGTYQIYNWAYEPHLWSGPSATGDHTGFGTSTTARFGTAIPEPANPDPNAPLIPCVATMTVSGRASPNDKGVISVTSMRYLQKYLNAFGDVVLTDEGACADNSPRVTKCQYNALGKLVRTVAPATEAGTAVTSVGYDERGWQKSVTDALNRTTTTTRLMLDRPDQITNALNQTVTTHYDSLDRVVKVVSPMLRETGTEYVGVSGLCGIATDPLQHASRQ